MEDEIKKHTDVLLAVADRHLGDLEQLDKYFGILRDITDALPEILAMDKEKLKYDRSKWIDRGSESGWWERPMKYEYETDVQSIATMVGQLMRFNKVIKRD